MGHTNKFKCVVLTQFCWNFDLLVIHLGILLIWRFCSSRSGEGLRCILRYPTSSQVILNAAGPWITLGRVNAECFWCDENSHCNSRALKRPAWDHTEFGVFIGLPWIQPLISFLFKSVRKSLWPCILSEIHSSGNFTP